MALPTPYERLVTLLNKADYPTICPSQPTFDAKLPTKTLYDDAEFVQSIPRKLVEEESKEVVLVLHSQSGVVGTQAVTEEFKAAREKKVLKGGVIRLLYMAGFVLQNGYSLGPALGGGLPPFIPEDGSCNMLEPARRFYNDLPPSEQEHQDSILKSHPAITQLTPLTNVGYKYAPSTYLLCEKDEALPLQIQKGMVVGFAGEVLEGSVGAASCTAGHSPFSVTPQRVVEFIKTFTE